MSHLRLQPPLRAVPPPAVSALPDVSWLCDEGPRRPGELREPIELGPEAVRELERSARAAGHSATLVAALLLEAALLREDLRRPGLLRDLTALDGAARAMRVRRRMSAAEADYLRALRVSPHSKAVGVVTVPVRLLGRLSELELGAAFAEDARRAVAWEAAALIDGRTMIEWGLLVALSASS